MVRKTKGLPRPSQEDRHAQILALLRRDGTLRIATMARTFGVTTETARRDLDELARKGVLKRTYGGAAARSLIDEPGIGARGRAHKAERERIAEAAAEMVEPGDVVMIDCGSTTTFFAQALAVRNLHLTVVTNCLPVATAVGANARCRVVICPGDLVMRENGVFGTDAVEFVRRFKSNKAFIGGGGVAADGVTDADSLACAVKRAMLDRADRAVLLVDSSKFDAAQFELVCPLDRIDDLVCEAPPPRELAAALRAAGVHVTLARR